MPPNQRQSPRTRIERPEPPTVGGSGRRKGTHDVRVEGDAMTSRFSRRQALGIAGAAAIGALGGPVVWTRSARATAINDAGQVTAAAIWSDGALHAVLLNPR